MEMRPRRFMNAGMLGTVVESSQDDSNEEVNSVDEEIGKNGELVFYTFVNEV